MQILHMLHTYSDTFPFPVFNVIIINLLFVFRGTFVHKQSRNGIVNHTSNISSSLVNELII